MIGFPPFPYPIIYIADILESQVSSRTGLSEQSRSQGPQGGFAKLAARRMGHLAVKSNTKDWSRSK